MTRRSSSLLATTPFDMTKKILIVDDEPHMLRVTELSLKKLGFDILTARNGDEAI